MAEKDKIEKLFFSHRDIFADVFNCCVFNGRQAVDSLMPARVLNYNISSYANQFGSGADKLYPVMTIVLYFGQKRWKASRQLEDLFDLENFPELKQFMDEAKLGVQTTKASKPY